MSGILGAGFQQVSMGSIFRDVWRSLDWGHGFIRNYTSLHIRRALHVGLGCVGDQSGAHIDRNILSVHGDATANIANRLRRSLSDVPAKDAAGSIAGDQFRKSLSGSAAKRILRQSASQFTAADFACLIATHVSRSLLSKPAKRTSSKPCDKRRSAKSSGTCATKSSSTAERSQRRADLTNKLGTLFCGCFSWPCADLLNTSGSGGLDST